MIYYYSIAAYIGFASLFERFVRDRNTLFILAVFCIFVLTCFAGLQCGIGPDQGAYIEIFENVPALLDWPTSLLVLRDLHSEYGFLLLNAIIKLFTDDATFLFIVVALAAVVINADCFRTYSQNSLLCLFVYYSHIFMYKEMIQIRNGLASALILFSIRYIVSKNIKGFLFTLCIATSFHLGAIIAVPFYYLCRIKISKRTLVILLLFGIALSQMQWLQSLLQTLSNVGLVPSRVATYVGWDLYNYSLGGISNPTTLKQLLVSIICILFYNRISSQSVYFKPIFYMYVGSTIWLLAFNEIAILAARMASYLSVGEPVLISSFMLINKRYNHITIFVVLALYSSILYLNLGVKGLLPPYQSVIGL